MPDSLRTAEDSVQSLLFETSPFGNLDALVEHDTRVIYFYLNGPPEFGTRACWVGNLQSGPLALNEQEMREGIPPLLPRIHCRQPRFRELPKSDDLRIVWFLEGNGAALLERNEVLAVIPPWSGVQGFHGYARDCCAENPLCFPIPTDSDLLARITRADQIWDEWQTQPIFRDLQVQQLELYENWFGRQQEYFAIDSNRFPPRGLVQLQNEKATTLLTVGMSLIPQPNVEMYLENPKEFRRIELACCIPKSVNPAEIPIFRNALSGLAAAPWKRWSWFGPRHTCDVNFGEGFQQAIFVDQQDFGIALPAVHADPVRLLFVAPITSEQLGKQAYHSDRDWLVAELMGCGWLPQCAKPTNY